MYRTEVIALKENIRVERQYSADGGKHFVRIDAYITDDLAKLPKFSNAWMKTIPGLLAAPSANICIEVPEASNPSENIFERCERLDGVVDSLVTMNQKALAEVHKLKIELGERPSPPCPCGNCGESAHA